MDISFIIVNYKSAQFLKRCVASIRAHAPAASHEIVVINNDEVPLENISGLKIIHSHKNEGFAKACNLGASNAEGKVFFFLNPDTELLDSKIESVVRSLDDQTVGVAAPRLVTPSGTTQPWSAGCEITLLDILRNNFGYAKSEKIWAGNVLDDIAWVSGAALTISQELFWRCGGFDEKFFLYFEDADLCRRVREFGKKIVILPDVQVLHLGGGSVADEKKQKQQYYRSQDYYFQKNIGLVSAFLVRFLRNTFLLFK